MGDLWFLFDNHSLLFENYSPLKQEWIDKYANDLTYLLNMHLLYIYHTCSFIILYGRFIIFHALFMLAFSIIALVCTPFSCTLISIVPLHNKLSVSPFPHLKFLPILRNFTFLDGSFWYIKSLLLSSIHINDSKYDYRDKNKKDWMMKYINENIFESIVVYWWRFVTLGSFLGRC